MNIRNRFRYFSFLFFLLNCGLVFGSEMEKKFGFGWDNGIIGTYYINQTIGVGGVINPGFTFVEDEFYSSEVSKMKCNKS